MVDVEAMSVAAGKMAFDEYSEVQKRAFVWMVQRMGPLEGRAKELRTATRGTLDVIVLDLRVRRGADMESVPDARVIAEAQMFSRAQPRSIVRHLNTLGFPEDFAGPQVSTILSKCLMREGDTTVICCVGDKVPRGGRLPPNACVPATG